MATAIFYASSTGNTEEVAKKIADNLNGIEIFDIADINVDKIDQYDKLVLGISTWGEGELQDDWEDIIENFSQKDFSGKTVSFFGLGDQDGYADNFLDAMGIVYEKVIQNNGVVIGSWDCDGYDFEESKAVVDGKFVGLAIDEDNQDELSDERITQWCDQIKDDIL